MKDLSFTVTATNPWYLRLWYLLSNPFTYLFKGLWRL